MKTYTNSYSYINPKVLEKTQKLTKLKHNIEFVRVFYFLHKIYNSCSMFKFFIYNLLNILYIFTNLLLACYT